MTKVKICGITNLEDAQCAAEAGCDALGFVFHKKSSRYIKPGKAKEIIRRLPAKMTKVGVFVDAAEKTVKRIAKDCNLNMLQFHGRESPAYCDRFKGYKIIKAFRVKESIDIEEIKQYRVFAYLFDSFVKAKPGGTGKNFRWALLKGMGDVKQKIFLSGGLSAANVRRAITCVRPDWVDVSSSLEEKPGKKGAKKIRRFIKIVQNKEQK